MATYWSDMADSHTCVYRAYLDGALAYVGLSRNPWGRFAHHASQKPWWRDCEVTIEWFPNRTEAQAAERQAIATERPIYNRQAW